MSTQDPIELPEHYAPPELIVFGELRQMIRGSGSPTRADFSTLDTDPAEPDTCTPNAAADGNDTTDDDCESYAPF